MRVSRHEMDKNHERIVAGAARMLRKRGVENTVVSEVMKEAGLTHGGFYRHFQTKEALLAAAIGSAFAEQTAALEARFKAQAAPAALAGYESHYLSNAHRAHPELGCPIAALGGDVARGSDALKAAFGAGVQQSIALIAKGMTGSDDERWQNAARELAMLAGAIMIARACDPETGSAVLDACRESSRLG
jgi:TetR/AcrR family transcriptional repressor of nem operon